MASIIERRGRWRALVRIAGQTRCATFDTKADAKAWGDTTERELGELRASGVMQAKGQTLGGLIDRYIREIYPLKPWGRTKNADLAVLKRELGHLPANNLTAHHFTAAFLKRQREGAGPVVLSSQIGYLVGVLEVARNLWHLDVAVKAATEAREALASLRLIGKSKRRDRRVSEKEIQKLLAYFDPKVYGDTTVPMAEITRFLVATAMRISEVCRLTWDDLDDEARTVIVRDRKHPQDKLGNDQVVPLLSNGPGYDAFEIARRQPRVGPRIFPYNSRTVSAYFTDAVEKLKLRDLVMHDLRHEGISRLFDAGYRIEQVALVSGHRDWASLKRYTHVRAADLHRGPEGR